jgi:hypothetical protein
MTKNEKVRSFENKRGSKREKKKKNAFCELESSFLLLFHYSFSFCNSKMISRA